MITAHGVLRLTDLNHIFNTESFLLIHTSSKRVYEPYLVSDYAYSECQVEEKQGSFYC